ncbi:MAG TPA: threonine synthase, partial [bacterium]|nr:threonine synthase [bacterium]
MLWRSTRGKCPPVDLRTALFRGLAADGGLYLPERWPELPASAFAGPPDLPAVASDVLHPFLDDVPPDDLRAICADALDFPVPLVELEEGVHVLELFHGPTCAFKDVGARFMARLMSWFLRDGGDDVTILVATSGDTGSAVAQAFLGVEGTRVVVLYPKGKVTPLQEKQFTTLGRNVTALAVEGTFDDCQRLAKAAFADADLVREVNLTSANSINVGRLFPQAVYYAHAVRQLPPGSPPPRFCTPSGNFGNLCAGLIAARCGMPAAGFIAATNVNDVVPEYLDTGAYRPRPSRETISNAMDVGDPSNFDRILDLYGGDADAIRRDLRGSRHDDDETRAAIRDVHARTGYVMDPHTAVGYLGLRAVPRSGGGPDVLLSTAHPAKFRESVEPVIGETVP